MEDMHIHVRDAVDDYSKLKLYIKHCIDLGLKKVLFVEHGPRISKNHLSRLDTTDKILKFKANIERAKKEYPNLQISCGIELDFSYDKEFNENNNKLTDIGFDYVISAIHHYRFTNGRDYLKAIIQMIDTCRFDIIGHMLLKYDWKNCLELIDIVLAKAKEKEIIIEINTSDRSRWEDDALKYMLRKMNEYGITYTISSDAHSVEEVGYMIAETTKKVEEFNSKKSFLIKK